MGKLKVVRRPLCELTPASQHPYQHQQKEQWTVTKAHDTRLVLKICKPSLAARQIQQPPPVKTQTPVPCIPALTRLRAGVTVRRRPVGKFVDHLADAMGFGGPLFPSSSSSYYDMTEGSTAGDDMKLATLLGFPVCVGKGCGAMPRSHTHSLKGDHWSESDPAPGFTQVMDAPDFSKTYDDEPQHVPSHSLLDMTDWHPHSLLLEGTQWTEPFLS